MTEEYKTGAKNTVEAIYRFINQKADSVVFLRFGYFQSDNRTCKNKNWYVSAVTETLVLWSILIALKLKFYQLVILSKVKSIVLA